jgi:hypothetical protein
VGASDVMRMSGCDGGTGDGQVLWMPVMRVCYVHTVGGVISTGSG